MLKPCPYVGACAERPVYESIATRNETEQTVHSHSFRVFHHFFCIAFSSPFPAQDDCELIEYVIPVVTVS
jgi:hypothetical protein